MADIGSKNAHLFFFWPAAFVDARQIDLEKRLYHYNLLGVFCIFVLFVDKYEYEVS